ncbi:glycosyl transferase, partial [Acidobacteriota bacterium]
IPSYQEADSIPFVVKQVDLGLQKYFSSYKTLIVNVDNHSDDNTKGAFLGTETHSPKHYISTPEGVTGKGNNFLNLFKFAQKNMETFKGGVVVDADLRSITPEWIKHLGEPVLGDFDYSLPLYSRHQFDGTITNHICYPMIYGLLSQDIRQPIGGEFGFSAKLLNYWLDQTWNDTTRQYGIDIFMTMNAIMGNFRICEVGLGSKVHKASAPKLGPMFTQVVTTLFEILLANESKWLEVPAVDPQKLSRFGLKSLGTPQELKIDILDLKHKLREEYLPRRPLLKKYLHDYTMTNLETMFEQDFYDINILMWTQYVFQLLHAYHKGSKSDREGMIEALKPLYFARSVTFNYLTWRYSVKYAERAVREQAQAFASQKPYLLGLHINGF